MAKGGTITWTNSDDFAHTVTKEGGPGPEFDSDNVDGGGTFKQKFTAVGKIDYLCNIHPGADGHDHRRVVTKSAADPAHAGVGDAVGRARGLSRAWLGSGSVSLRRRSSSSAIGIHCSRRVSRSSRTLSSSSVVSRRPGRRARRLLVLQGEWRAAHELRLQPRDLALQFPACGALGFAGPSTKVPRPCSERSTPSSSRRW